MKRQNNVLYVTLLILINRFTIPGLGNGFSVWVNMQKNQLPLRRNGGAQKKTKTNRYHRISYTPEDVISLLRVIKLIYL